MSAAVADLQISPSGFSTHSGSNIVSPQLLGVSNWLKDNYVGSPGRTETRSAKMLAQDELEAAKVETKRGPVDSTGSRIMVYVRMRPMSKTEKDSGARCCVRVVNGKDVYLTEFASEIDYLRLKRVKGRHFMFDAAFSEASDQQEVYDVSAAGLVEGVLQGRNGSIFCYGATGAGKTHTMLGTTQCPGVMVLALKDLFLKLKQRCQQGDYVVRLSYLEVYNESVRDLLSPGRRLVLREDSKQGIVAAGLTQYDAYSADEIMTLLHRGNQNRTTEPTRVNETSSRSHAILQVIVEYRHESPQFRRVGKLSLIDLAGSERALATDQRSIRSLEGANINRSLLALSSCINALVEGKRHIPFRNSKLTQLLKDSLGGACQTSMIANISPSNLSFGETQNTLHWADRAKQIRKGCVVNEEIQILESEGDKAKLLLEVQKENQQLRLQLARMQQKLLALESSAVKFAHQSPATAPCYPVSHRSPKGEGKARHHEGMRNMTTVQNTLHFRRAAANGKYTRHTPVQGTRRMTIGENLRTDVVDEGTRRMTMGGAARVTAAGSTKIGMEKLTLPINASMISMARESKVLEDVLNRNMTTAAAACKALPQESQMTTRRLSKIAQPPPPEQYAMPNYKAPSSGSNSSEIASLKKRPFWDISNGNSPSAAYSTSNNVAGTSSMLLQPGFMGGGRRRRLLE